MAVQKATPHDSALLHVTGQARYTDDIPLPRGTLHLAFGLSETAAGTITAMDLAEVRAAEGVVSVLTAADLPFANDVSPSIGDEPLLSPGEVRYLGQPLFLVIARSHLAARKAARLASIDYREAKPILTLDEALKAEAFFEPPLFYRRGDAEAALSNSARKIEGSMEIGGQEHFYLEGQAAAAELQEDGIVIHASTQHPSEIQHKVAEALGLPFAAVRVQTRRMGGGFGGKESQGNALAVACAVAARHIGRPTSMRYDRDDDFIITGKRHDLRIRYKAGFDDDGTLQAVSFIHDIRCGWALDLSLPVADRAMLHADNAYFLPNVMITSHRLRTNTQSNTAFRGFGGPQGMVGIERVMDHIAHELRLDPLEVRRRNLYGAAPRNTTHYGQVVEDNIAPALINRLAETSGYEARKAAIELSNDSNPVIKRGIALTPVKFGISFTLTHLNQAGALVHVYSDGSIHLNHGGTEMGQGLNTKVGQVAAAVFGQPLEAVKITATDTGKVPNTSATAASSGSDLNGMACKAACETIRDRLVEFASQHWQQPASAISFTEDGVEIGSEVVAFADLVKAAYMHRVSLSATGFYATPKINWDRLKGQGRPFFYFAYGAAVTEVAIDTLTGENRILRTDILHDCGTSLNPALDIGQIEGGYVQGAGWLTMEELVWDDKGGLRTHAPSTYKIPAASDRPGVFNVALWDAQNNEETIYRSKAVGEPPLMLGISALMALSHAIEQCAPEGPYPSLDAPATPERILRTIAARTGEEW
ncbi:xanthine dehydrogenase molybdopterin binding subunit [Algicella marina]|uniref:Xanthine dehydrogenase molybdopterin binding subunit n=1 Tax=Algicella marina TaxID=2683284 RepID=A0A6P1T136_9RHOB|nr:xanthine dehydrogenase molybdopterin binding subunit [Algicella marina]QHQ35707.1 xanthine dehydrogenase molybdopterin binding subunit [Algicella marina]